jgi:hypothetical protein
MSCKSAGAPRLPWAVVSGNGGWQPRPEMRKGADWFVYDDARMAQNFLELSCRCSALFCAQVCLAAQVNGIEGEGEGSVSFRQLVRPCYYVRPRGYVGCGLAPLIRSHSMIAISPRRAGKAMLETSSSYCGDSKPVKLMIR